MKSSLQREIDEWLGNETSLPVPSKPVINLPFFDMVDGMITYSHQRRIW